LVPTPSGVPPPICVRAPVVELIEEAVILELLGLLLYKKELVGSIVTKPDAVVPLAVRKGEPKINESEPELEIVRAETVPVVPELNKLTCVSPTYRKDPVASIVRPSGLLASRVKGEPLNRARAPLGWMAKPATALLAESVAYTKRPLGSMATVLRLGMAAPVDAKGEPATGEITPLELKVKAEMLLAGPFAT